MKLSAALGSARRPKGHSVYKIKCKAIPVTGYICAPIG
jgi:hypothetical protein